jgi:hypothetical protein
MQKFGEGFWELGLSKQDEVGADEVIGSYLLAEIESDFIFLFSNIRN